MAAANSNVAQLRTPWHRDSDGYQKTVTTVAMVLFFGVLVLRFVFPTNDEPILLLELVPVALIAWEFGPRLGVIAGAIAFCAFLLYASQWGAGTLETGDTITRFFAFLAPVALIGWLAQQDRTARAALEESEKTFRFIAEESSDTISTHSPDGDYTYVSGRCREMLGYEPEELIGTSPYRYYHPDDLELIERTHAETLDTRGITTMTYRARRKDGRYVWFVSRLRTVRNPETGEVEELHCSTHDVTEPERDLAVMAEGRRAARARIEAVLAGDGPAIVYQPIVELSSGRTVEVEALSRFAEEPNRPPNLWFEEAWAVGLGQELELKAIAAAIRGATALPKDCAIAVNASPQTIQAPAMVACLASAKRPVIVEVTEHADISDLAAFTSAAAVLRNHNVRLAIDDAGSGFSGLRRLLDLDPDMVKLDLSLTKGIDRDPKRRALASGLVGFATAAGVEVVAEGIETKRERDALRLLGVELGQGYHLGRPVSAGDLDFSRHGADRVAAEDPVRPLVAVR